MDTVCWPYREPGLAGGQELLLGHWSAALTSSLLGDSQNPLTRDREATPSPLILDAFAHPSPPAESTDKSPSKGGAHYLGNVTGAGQRAQGAALRFPLRLELRRLFWQCRACRAGQTHKSPSDTAAGPASFPNTGKSSDLGVAKEGGYGPQSGEEVVHRGINERATRPPVSVCQ